MSLSPSLRLVDEFLRSNAWTPAAATERYLRYTPLADLGLEESFALTVPAHDSLPGAAELLSRVVATLASVHELSEDQLRIVLAVPDTVVSVQVSSQATEHGAIPLPMFESVVERLRLALRHTAAFALSDSPVLEDSDPDEAQDYVARCQFLQTERGSFIAKVQLPSAQTLAEPSFFKPKSVTSDDVNTRLEQVVDFAVNSVLAMPHDQLHSRDVLVKYSDAISVDVIEDLAAIFERTAATEVNIRFLSAKSGQLYRSGKLSNQRLQRLSDFASFARSHYAALIPVDFRGKIVELRSRNPRGNRNYVLLAGVYDGKPAYLSMSLPRLDYWHATQAHALGQSIRVAGFARQLKTQLKLVDRELFQVLDMGKPDGEAY